MLTRRVPNTGENINKCIQKFKRKTEEKRQKRSWQTGIKKGLRGTEKMFWTGYIRHRI
jgi:hypothetical protein